jgi:D-sedoheptulose 7-phosphate isomerase
MTHATSYFQTITRLLSDAVVTDDLGQTHAVDDAAHRAIDMILQVGDAGGKVILVGNGGSASIAGHMQMDLCNRAYIPALVFNDAPLITALSNDYGYVDAFERLSTLWAEPNNCMIAISSSGQSPNILRAVQCVRSIGAHVITFSGFKAENPLRRMGDLNFYIASSAYGEVEVAHHALGHYLTDCLVEIANEKLSSRAALKDAG